MSRKTFIPASRFSEEGVRVQAQPGMLTYGQILPGYQLSGGEIVLLAIKPSLWFLILVSIRWLLMAAAVIFVSPWVSRFYPDLSASTLTQGALLITAIRLMAALLQWSSRLYVLTNRRVLCCRGVLHVAIFESPLVQIRNTYVKSRPVEKMCDVGSIGLALQDSRRIDAWWEQIAQPNVVHDHIRRAIEKALDNHLPY